MAQALEFNATQYEHIKLDQVEGFPTITMVRSHRRNSLSEDHIRELFDAFEVIANSDARGVVLAAEGPVFSSGHDFNDMYGRDMDGMKKLLDLCGKFMQFLQQIPQPVVAQVEGLAIDQKWPESKGLNKKTSSNIAIQVNGKLRGNIEVEKTISRENVLSLAKEHENTKIFLDQKEIVKEIFVPGKIINFVVK